MVSLTMASLSIIILTYNTKDVTVKCLQSLFRQYKNQLQKREFEVIVVDNASTDGTLDAIGNLRSQFSNSWTNLTLINNKENFGFAKGNNIGVAQAKGKYVFFLNSDTEIKDDGLERMVSYMESSTNNIGILGAKLHNADGSTQTSAGVFYSLPQVFFMLLGGERFGFLRKSPKKITDVDWVSGAALMMQKKLFDQLRGFDEHFFMYVEDMDLCYRVMKNGKKVVFYPNVHIVHMEQGSSDRSFAILHIYKGLLYFYKKHKNYIQYIIVKVLLMLKALLAIMIGIVTGNRYLVSTYRKALIHAL